MPPLLMLNRRGAVAREVFKSQPTLTDVHVNTPLTVLSVAYLQDPAFYVADQVFPVVPVLKASDRYYVYQRDDFYRDEAKERAPGSESAGGGYNLDNTPSYAAKIYAYHKDVPDQIRANADAVLNMDRDAMVWLAQKLMIQRERLFATKYVASSVWDNDLAGVSTPASVNATHVLQWNDVASDPINDVETQKAAILLTGKMPNVLMLSYDTFRWLRNHPDIIDRVKYGGGPANPATISEDALAQVFGVAKVVVAKGVYASSNEGAATATYARIMSKNALLAYAPSAPSILEASAGYIFAWTGLLGANALGARIKSFRMEWLESDRIEGELAYDMVKVSGALGAYWDSVVA